MISVFDYTDYRRYLEDWYTEKKKENGSFSYQLMAERAGFANRGFVYLLVKGKRSISRDNCLKLSHALGHDRYEEQYFENLVAFNHAKGMKEQDRYFGNLCRIKARGKGPSALQTVNRSCYEFYSTWYHSAVRSIIDLYEFRGDWKWLSQMLTPAITAKQAERSVRLLERLGMIERDRNGIWHVTARNITTGNEVAALGIRNFHLGCNELATKAIASLPVEQRNVTGLTMGISPMMYGKICEEIDQFQNRIAEMVSEDDSANRVYQLNFHLFPLSKPDGERKGKQ
ncbi:MAG: TIGR02147 family protein [Chitinispirillaceae bacterium]|nr:TIGR02147 family protein [Chitinispirillaceae bacterium]